jgi:chemotaxis protein MotB
VGAGKFRDLQTKKAEGEKAWTQEKSKLDLDIKRLNSRNEEMNLELTRQNTLLSELLNDKMDLEKEVTSLRDRLSSLSNESKSVEAVLNLELEKKNENLKVKEARLNRMINWLLQQEDILAKISTQLGEAMTGYGEDQIEWIFQDNRLDIILYQDFISGNQRSLTGSGSAAISKLARIIAEYPSLDILVEGHTDNSISQTGEALAVSTQRAVVVCAYLVDDGGINGNQLTACGRGSYYPRVSNQTPAGRSLNNRVEISLRPPYQQLLTFLEE